MEKRSTAYSSEHAYFSYENTLLKLGFIQQSSALSCSRYSYTHFHKADFSLQDTSTVIHRRCSVSRHKHSLILPQTARETFFFFYFSPPSPARDTPLSTVTPPSHPPTDRRFNQHRARHIQRGPWRYQRNLRTVPAQHQPQKAGFSPATKRLLWGLPGAAHFARPWASQGLGNQPRRRRAAASGPPARPAGAPSG